MLKKCGYRTAILGKWHLAGYPKDFTKSPMHPLECGFDYHFGTPGSNDVPAPLGKIQNRKLFVGPVRLAELPAIIWEKEAWGQGVRQRKFSPGGLR